jgi:hypothetical protein
LPFRKTRSSNYNRRLEIDLKSSIVINSPMPSLTAAVLALALCLNFGGSSFARTKSGGPRPPLDSDYTSALAAANHFLQAWQMHDQETAVLLLTNAAKQHCSEDRLDSFFASDSQAAYEIGRGKKLKTGRYLFPIAIFAGAIRTLSGSSRPHHTNLIVTRTGNREWGVDKLP